MLIGSDNKLSFEADARRAGPGVVLREATAGEIAAWDETVERFSHHRIFHKTCWLRYLESVTSGRALFLIYEKDGEVVGCLPGLLVRKGGLRIFGSPLMGWQTESMGPIFDESRIDASEIARPLALFLSKSYGVQHIELTSAHMDAGVMGTLRFRGKQVSTYRVPLFPGDEERALKNFRATARNRARWGMKVGLLARFETDETFVDEFYDQMREVFKRRAVTIPFTHRRVLECFRHLKASGNLLAISIRLPDERETCIATGLFMIEGQELHLWAWAHRTIYGSYSPMELLTWAVMRKGMEAGCVTLDLAGGGDAKLKYGAVMDRSLHHWMWSRYEWLAQLRDGAEKAYRWQQRLRGRLARGMSLGPHASQGKVDERSAQARPDGRAEARRGVEAGKR